MKSTNTKLNVAYFSLSFPELSQTFVFNEMRGLRNEGAQISVAALRHSGTEASNLPQKYGFSDIRYIMPTGVRSSKRKRILMVLRALARRPLRFITLLRAARNAKTSGLDMPFAAIMNIAAALQSPGKRPVIHCHFGTAGLVVTTLKKLKLIDAPVSVVFHGYDITQYLVGQPHRLYADLFEQADVLLPISDLWHRRLIELGAPPKKIHTVRLGIDCGAFSFRERLKPHGETLRFITVGRMMEKKGHRYALEAFIALATRRPDIDIRLDVIGSGPLFDDMKAIADCSGLGDKLVLHGSLQHDEVRGLLGSAHVFVLPSVTAANGDMEGIPVAIMEAMAMGLAVISTHHSGIPELVADGSSGLLVPERDIEALSAAMEYLTDHPDRIVPMGRAGRQIIEDSYDEQKQAKKLHATLGALK